LRGAHVASRPFKESISRSNGYPGGRRLELSAPTVHEALEGLWHRSSRRRSASDLAGIDLGGAVARPMAAVPNEHARFDLTVTAIEVAADIELEFEYSTDLFREDNVERWMAGLRTLLEQAAARPRAPISELSLTDAAARGELLRVGRGRSSQSVKEKKKSRGICY